MLGVVGVELLPGEVVDYVEQAVFIKVKWHLRGFERLLGLWEFIDLGRVLIGFTNYSKGVTASYR